VQIHRSANSDAHVSQIPRNRNNKTDTQRSNEENFEDINRFLHDFEMRPRLLNISRDEVDIRKASLSYNKSKSKRKSEFEPQVILLRKKGDKNMVPKKGSPE
jgi:hypothetical protein